MHQAFGLPVPFCQLHRTDSFSCSIFLVRKCGGLTNRRARLASESDVKKIIALYEHARGAAAASACRPPLEPRWSRLTSRSSPGPARSVLPFCRPLRPLVGRSVGGAQSSRSVERSGRLLVGPLEAKACCCVMKTAARMTISAATSAEKGSAPGWRTCTGGWAAA